MNNIHAYLKQALLPFGMGCSQEQNEQFTRYAQLLLEWNEKMNLTAITQPREIAVKHFADSVALLSFIQFPKNARVIDIGTGAGFPGIPLKIMQQEIDLSLLDSLNKRVTFLQQVAHELNIPITAYHSRAEDGGRNNRLREKFDVAVSRAVAPLNILAEYCIPYTKVGGKFLAMKGPNAEEEIMNAKAAIETLGGKIAEIKEYKLADDYSRTLIIIEKIKQTPPSFPRQNGKIAKKAL